ncbi:MAG: hypothetical protein PHU42_03135 [Patescibacteria group bacterium]|nr:hypothetical protein [Patescibacteria group bacterium]
MAKLKAKGGEGKKILLIILAIIILVAAIAAIYFVAMKKKVSSIQPGVKSTVETVPMSTEDKAALQKSIDDINNYFQSKYQK